MYFNKKIKIVIAAKDVLPDIPKFIKRLKKDGYSNLSIEEYWYTKFLAWTKDDKIRFIIQSYGGNDVETEFDKLIDENLFYNEFDKLYKTLKNKLAHVNYLHRKFKQDELLLKSLPWKLYTDISETLYDYIPLDSECAKTEKFKNFVKKVNEKSEEHTLDFKTCKKDFCMRQEDYYYKIKDNKLIRYLWLTSKDKEILRYLKLYNIKPNQNANLESLYNDVIKNSCREAITCYLGDDKVRPYTKEARIYEDGGIEAPSASDSEIKELQDVIAQIVTDKKKTTFSVDDFSQLLREYGVHVSSLWSDRVMNIKKNKVTQ